jgi:hypothetical protein
MEKIIECNEEKKGINFNYESNIKKYIGDIHLKNISSNQNVIVKLFINSFNKFTVEHSLIFLKKGELKTIKITREQINIFENEKNKFLIISIPTDKEITNINEAKQIFCNSNYKVNSQKIIIFDNYKIYKNVNENEKDIGTHYENDFVLKKEIIREEIIKEKTQLNDTLNKTKIYLNRSLNIKFSSNFFYYFLMSSIILAVIFNRLK